MKRNKGKYWYYSTEYECALCGAITKYQERKYTQKPKDYNKRHTIKTTACSDHFVSN